VAKESCRLKPSFNGQKLAFVATANGSETNAIDCKLQTDIKNQNNVDE